MITLKAELERERTHCQDLAKQLRKAKVRKLLNNAINRNIAQLRTMFTICSYNDVYLSLTKPYVRL